jgi:LysM repeat protein
VVNFTRHVQRWRVALLTTLAMVAVVPSAHAVTHIVRAGETVKTIAAAHGTTAVAIVRANAMANADVLQIGQRLEVPATTTPPVARPMSATGTVTVHPGDTLGAIAARTGTTARAIADANTIADPNRVRVGTRLRLPSGAASPAVVSGGGGPSPTSGIHVVRAGDTLTSIALRSGTTARRIARANAMRSTDILTIGRRLVIPAAGAPTAPSVAPAPTGRYIVRAGDTLGAIAARHGISAQALAAANGLQNANVIAIGQRLRIPGRTAVTTPSPTQITTSPRTAARNGWGGQPGMTQIRAMIAQSAGRYGVDPALVRAIAWQESGWWQGARSSAGALGVMQLMPDTATWVGSALVGRRLDPTNARDNIDGGTAYVAWLMRQTTNRNQAVAAYYQGLGSVQRRGMYADTREYVRSVNSHYGVR